MRRSLSRALGRSPLRIRITVAATASIAVILAALSLLVYGRLHAQLLAAIDSGLQARASAIAASVGQLGSASQAISDGPDGLYAAPVQIVTRTGRVVARSGADLPPPQARLLNHLSAPATVDRTGPGRSVPARLYLLPVDEGRPLVIVAGTSLAGVEQTMSGLRLQLLIGGPDALVLASLVAWLMTGAALRPIERMRREAAGEMLEGRAPGTGRGRSRRAARSSTAPNGR